MMKKLTVLDLFSGIGGFSLGLERAGFQTVAFCEIEEYPRSILKKHWPDVPIYEDVKKLKGDDIGAIDVICGGFPCQPFSVAGKQRGKDDDRYLWPEMFRLLQEKRPTWLIGENVAGIIPMALDNMLYDLESEGYTAQTFVIPACAVGGIHRRDRVWIVAHSNYRSQKRQQRNSNKTVTKYYKNKKQMDVIKLHFEKLLPTPKRSDYKGSVQGATLKKRRQHTRGVDLPEEMARKISNPSEYRLNPLFVTEMMGFPITWLD